jgi:hypothetical protein
VLPQQLIQALQIRMWDQECADRNDSEEGTDGYDLRQRRADLRALGWRAPAHGASMIENKSL